MFKMTKEEKDLYISQMISNIAHDKMCFNIENRKEFTSHHEVSSYLREEIEEAEEEMENLKKEIEETEEEMENLKKDFELYWFYCKHENRYDKRDFFKQLNLIADTCKNLINEVFDTYAVALKAMEQGKEWEE